MSANVPELRFSGFADPWEQRKLGEVVGATYGGGTPSTLRDEYWNGSIPWIQSSNVLENELFLVDIPKAITQEGLKKSSALLVPKDSIAVVTHVGVGKLAYLPFPYATSQDFVSLSELKGDAVYLCYAIFRKLQSELHIVQGSAIKGITKDELLNKLITLSNEEEQHKIGTLFSRLDNLITLHQRKHNQLSVLKGSLLEGMFPKPGSDVPELRFSGFADPWEQRKLGELATRITAMSSEPGLPRVEYEDINSGQGTLNKDLAAKEPTKTGIEFLPGDVLYGKLRPYLMNWLYPQFRGIAVGDFWVLRPTDTDGSFLYRFIQSERFQYNANISSGSKMPRADWAFVSEDNYLVPSNREEQRLIGTIFQQLDSLIALHQRKPDALKTVIKSLLDNILV